MAITPSTAPQEWVTITKDNKPISGKEVAVIFEKLPPVAPEALIGEWAGHGFNTGHPGNDMNKKVGWAGKTFRSVDDVDPMVLHGEGGKRVWMEAAGRARLREVKYQGVVSTAMIYNEKPIIDHFRRVSDNMVAGVMDTTLFPEEDLFYFYLTKL